MTPLQQIYIGGSDLGLRSDVKPFLLPDKAFSTLDNAYVWRDRVLKKEGSEFLGRLRRQLLAQSGGNINLVNPSPNEFNLFTLLGLLTSEPNAQVDPGTVANPITIVIGAQTLTDTLGTGTFSIAPAGNITGATINYATGVIIITFAAPAGPLAVTISMFYFPGLPVMGIWQREIVTVNNEQTIFFDTKYAYINSSGLDNAFTEFLAGSGVTWSGDDADFFYCTNYRGSDAFNRLFFVTNFNNGNNVPQTFDPIRYTDGTTWTTFEPIIADNPPSAAQFKLFQAKILIPYYGRLLALNTWEGSTAGGAILADNYFNRCRFSQIGNPVAADAWRSDIFGKGGFIDAPTNEAIQSAIFYKNTLIVGFERSTWQLRYVGEYGLPFIWERISSDFGCDSTFSTVLFDQGILQVADKGIVSSSAVNVQRIDLQIPDVVFGFKNQNDGKQRVYGVRNFQKELVYWCYVDEDLEPNPTDWKFPNRSLVYNYRNNTYAKFRNNVTCFGTYQSVLGITWDRTDIFWDDMDVFWDDVLFNPEFPSIVAGNQQGYIVIYCNSSIEEPSQTITAIDLTANPVRVTSPNHNLQNSEWIKIDHAIFLPVDPVASAINDSIFNIVVIDKDTFDLFHWDGTSVVAYTNASASLYVGKGEYALLSKIDIQTKDFNPFQQQGSQTKISYIDFLTDATPDAKISVELILNSAPAVIGNVIVGNKQVETSLTPNYYLPGSEYAWHRFFATSTGQFIRIKITYDNELMSTKSIHQQNFILNAISLYVRQGSRNVF